MKLSWAFLWVKLVLISFLPVPGWQRASGVASKSPFQSLWTQACDAAGPCRKRTSHHCRGKEQLPSASTTSSMALPPLLGYSASLAPISYSLHLSGSILTIPPLPVLGCIPVVPLADPGNLRRTNLVRVSCPPGAHLQLVSSGFRPDSGRAIVTPALMLRDYSFHSAMFNGILNGIYEEAHRL